MEIEHVQTDDTARVISFMVSRLKGVSDQRRLAWRQVGTEAADCLFGDSLETAKISDELTLALGIVVEELGLRCTMN